MTTTVVLANLPTNPNDVAVHTFASGVFGLRKFESNADLTSFTSEYILKASDPKKPTTVRFSNVLDKDGSLRRSLRLRTYETVATDGVEVSVQPYDVIVTWVGKGPTEDTSAVMKMIGVAFGLTFDSLVSKVPQTGVLAAINNGLLGDILG